MLETGAELTGGIKLSEVLPLRATVYLPIFQSWQPSYLFVMHGGFQ